MNLNLLRSVMLGVVQAQPVEPILRKIVEGLVGSSDVALARIWLFQPDEECPVCSLQADESGSSRALHLMASAGRSKVTKKDYSKVDSGSHKIQVGHRKIGRIAESREPMLIEKVERDQSWVADPEWIVREEIQSFAGHPLICRDELLGVLALFSRTPFSAEDFSWLGMFADNAAVAIWNARAFEELNRLRTQLQVENEYLTEEIKEAVRFGDIIGHSKALEKVVQQVHLVAETEVTVLILGESGTGKEVVARAIHERSSRRDRPFVKVNCGAIPEALFESEFFGHVKGAFTGAVKDRIGRFEIANGGDLFLDEIGELPLSVQPKLLRVLQEKQFERVGDTRTRSVDVRIIAATNRNLKEQVAVGRFREDLFYRLTVFPIEVPPLRERKEDIGPLAMHFLRKSAERLKITGLNLTRADLRKLEEYDWPGNVRELENVIERATILSRRSGRLTFDLPRFMNRSHGRVHQIEGVPVERGMDILSKEDLKQQEVQNLIAALEKANGKIFGVGGAAELLGMKLTTLASRLKALGIQRRFVHPA